MGKVNLQNLSPTNTVSKEEARRRGSLGGKNSGKAKRAIRTMKELMKQGLSLSEADEETKEYMIKRGWDMDAISQLEVITQAQIEKAKNGDTAAYNAIRDIVGEKPTDKHEHSYPDKIEIGFVTTGVTPVNREEDVQ